MKVRTQNTDATDVLYTDCYGDSFEVDASGTEVYLISDRAAIEIDVEGVKALRKQLKKWLRKVEK